jgi:hypothetical protein
MGQSSSPAARSARPHQPQQAFSSHIDRRARARSLRKTAGAQLRVGGSLPASVTILQLCHLLLWTVLTFLALALAVDV